MPFRPAMEYSLDNALFQWRQGERRLRDAPELDGLVEALVDELRRRLGSSFTLQELADLYASGTDWAEDTAARRGARGESAQVVDAAFGRYAREASDFAGGRVRQGGRRT